MTSLELSSVATAYYEKNRSATTYAGFERYVATNGVVSMFVNSDYEIEEDGIVVFKLVTVFKQSTSCQLYKPRNRDNQK